VERVHENTLEARFLVTFWKKVEIVEGGKCETNVLFRATNARAMGRGDIIFSGREIPVGYVFS
jgi:hypothetical protein